MPHLELVQSQIKAAGFKTEIKNNAVWVSLSKRPTYAWAVESAISDMFDEGLVNLTEACGQVKVAINA